MRRTVALTILAFAPLAFFSGCNKAEVTTYRVPKENAPEPVKTAAAPASTNAPATTPAPAPTPAAPSAGASMASTAVPTATGAGLAWKAPAHWTDKGASGMRKGTFAIPGDGGAAGELAITAFPGDVGGEVANVNRWRGQVQLPPLSDAQVPAAITRLEANGLKIGVVELSNGGSSMLGAFVAHAGSTWFFKFTGPDALVAKEKAAFLEFVKSIRPAS